MDSKKAELLAAELLAILKTSLGLLIQREVGDEDIYSYYGYMAAAEEREEDQDAALRGWVEQVRAGQDVSGYIGLGQEILGVGQSDVS